MSLWLFGRAPKGGVQDDVNDRFYKGGEMLPFYVPRPIMPQLEEADYVDFIIFAIEEGVTITPMTFDTDHLRPHQRIDKIKAERMTPDILKKPVWVSVDGFVLDGNHRWLAHKMAGTPVIAFVINQRFSEAIETMLKFPKTTELKLAPETN